ncbi:MAG: hypothetical protein MK137_06795 [Rickettsiales bacterium]|nr:hypothetical protein [Rickettsiales bacterium]
MNPNDDQNIIIRQAVKETMIGLGFDTDDPREMQKDLLHLRKIRKGSEELSRKAKTTMIAIAVSSGAYIFWEALKRAILFGKS